MITCGGVGIWFAAYILDSPVQLVTVPLILCARGLRCLIVSVCVPCLCRRVVPLRCGGRRELGLGHVEYPPDFV